jgi:coiled-coil and C2 domain-containing protein 2A
MGSVTIPLAAVLRIDGFVRCTTPDYIVGYTNQPNTLLLGNFDDGKAQDSTRPAQLMLRVHATTDPIVTIPTKSLPNFPSNENVEVLSRVKQWSGRYLEGTNSTVLWSDIHGFGYLASRFLTAQNPPNIRTMTVEGCAHYVSLIPLKRTWRSLERLNMSQHLVLTTTQTLDILAGDATEHAVLLANYFLYLSKKNPSEYSAHVCLVLGHSIREGRTVSTWLSQPSHDENSFNLCPTIRYGSCVKAALEMFCFGRLHLDVPFPAMTTRFRCRKSIA